MKVLPLSPYSLADFYCLLALCSSLSLFFGQPLQAQPLRFEHMAEKHGFLGNAVNDILQDEQGFLWIATPDGLGRYDGVEVVEYRSDRNDATTISNNNIKNFWLAPGGEIWIGTGGGLNCYDPQTAQFRRYYFEELDQPENSNYVLGIRGDHMGYIWYATYSGVYRLDPVSGEHISIALTPEKEENSFLEDLTWAIYEDQKKRLWFANKKGIVLYKNDGSFEFERIIAQKGHPDGLTHDYIFDFTEQEDGTLWVSSHFGLYRVMEMEGRFKFKRYFHDPQNDNSLSYDFIESFWAEGNERLWVSTWAGGLDEIWLPKAEGQDLRFIHHQHDPTNPLSLNLNKVNCSFRDRSGILWVGTKSGLDKVVESNWKVATVTPIKNDLRSLSHNIVKSVLQDRRGNLWVGTLKGLNFLSKENWEKKNFEFQVFHHDKNDPATISHDNIFGMQEDSLGFLWLGTYNGLNYIDLNSLPDRPVFRTLPFPDDKPHTWVYNILEIQKGQYWISTYGGLVRMHFDPRKDREARLEIFEMDTQRNDALVNSMNFQLCKDRFGEYWIATFMGLSRHYQKEGKDYFDNYKLDRRDNSSLSSNSIICIHSDKKGRLWIGTRNGLNLAIRNNKEERVRFKSFGRAHGFPNDVIQSIEEDQQGRLWLGTNNGLIQFDPEAALNNQPAVLRVLKEDDGLLSRGLVYRSATKINQDTLCLGTAEGLIYFNPLQLKDNPNLPEVRLTHLTISNQEVRPENTDGAILKKTISLTDTLILKHDQNDITLAFAALDYANPSTNQYEYQLENYNKDWIFNAHNNIATYTNLPPGAFVFKVRAANNDGLWNENPRMLHIHILPPWWKTWWAYGGYLLLFTTSLYLLIRWRVRRRIRKIEQQAQIQAARYEEREALRKNNAADFHDELGHRLTKVSLFLELAEREAPNNTKLKKFLTKIKSNTTGLSEGIRDLIWSLDPQKDSLFQTLTRLQEFGDRLFEFSDIRFQLDRIDSSLEQIELEPDTRKQVLMIFKEAMNNTLKYSYAEKALLQTQVHNGHILIIFKDDGQGFDLTKATQGYGLKNMEERAERITAQLTIKAVKGEGTCITLRMEKQHYSALAE
ncbi:MAG: two-component regulator propeller domain-containing protein [Bacteroidota bacterium]